MIIDGHSHLSDSDYGNIQVYLTQLEETGIDQAVLVPGGMVDVRKMTDYITGRAEPESTVPNNAYITKACQENDRFHGFACIDPHSSDSAAHFESYLKAGFRGLKFSPLTHQFTFTSRAVADLIACCSQYGVPVYSHVLYSPGACTAKFVSLAKQYPKVNFILGHMGFGPADQEGLEAAVSLDNFFLETSTGSFLHIQESVRRAGPSKIIFGSEFPLSHPKAELEKILLLKLSDDEREKILGKNIAELIQLG
ncbi:amidohydrolase family protein [Heliobacillus mobilis]|uniref:Amidohydrolase family protein n=1 Tax=Heliobacterium mobile TaxID=28064 RepID=A0A6I3SNW1_HELMO|nr:amidohydrolase family protein [Heliobacterium mobile]MTV50395.1 amidohydrolase family protein [Heliobacterium mobile]